MEGVPLGLVKSMRVAPISFWEKLCVYICVYLHMTKWVVMNYCYREHNAKPSVYFKSWMIDVSIGILLLHTPSRLKSMYRPDTLIDKFVHFPNIIAQQSLCQAIKATTTFTLHAVMDMSTALKPWRWRRSL